MCMPEVPEDLFMEALATLVELDKAWVPTGDDAALYIPTIHDRNGLLCGSSKPAKNMRLAFSCVL